MLDMVRRYFIKERKQRVQWKSDAQDIKSDDLKKLMKALSDTLHSVSLGPSVSLQMPYFHFFSWLSNVPLHAFVTSSLSVHLSVDIKVLPCPVVNSTAINIRVHVSFRIMVFYRHVPRSGIAGSHGSSTLYSTLYSTQCFVMI